jgi:NAD kinase/nicotinic acid mononucleotide adenylyltransferase
MPDLTADAIRANLDALAAPPGWPKCHPAALAGRLCAAQQSLAPVTTPRRLVIFAADHRPDEDSEIGPAIREIASGAAATAVLAQLTGTDLVLVDVGSECHPQRESANYRCRKVRTARRGSANEPWLTIEEVRAAVDVGREEAEIAARDGMKVVATDGLGASGERAASAAAARLRLGKLIDPAADPLQTVVGVGAADLAAAAGFIARAAELDLTVLIEGTLACAAAELAERLYPGTAASVLRVEEPNPPDLRQTPPPAGSDTRSGLLDVREGKAGDSGRHRIPAPREALPEVREGKAGDSGRHLLPVARGVVGGGSAGVPGAGSAGGPGPAMSAGSPAAGGLGLRVPSPSDGLGALFAFQALDALAAIITNTARRIHARDQVVSIKRRKVAVFTGSFDPPSAFHRRVATMLRSRGFDEIIVRPNGPRCNDELEHASPIHRAVMADLAFRDLPGVTVDLADLDDGVFTPHVAFDDLHADRGEVWHIVSDEFIAGGCNGQSWIQTKWECGDDAWRSGRFVILHRHDCVPDPRDLPPVHQLFTADGHVPTADIRTRVFQGGSVRSDVPEAVDSYIRRYGLFSGKPSPRETRVRLCNLRLKLVFDERNEKARAFAARFAKYESSDPTHILVLGGDGTMLQAIRDYWRLRLPFVGLNAGTLGFLMNESLPLELEGSELLLYRLPMLRVDTERADGAQVQGLACGDAWVERESGQAAWLRIDVDGRTQVSRVVGDGLLVATPTGASSYARAMGATPVPLTAPVLTLAGSNIFLPRFWRPVALTECAAVRISSLTQKGEPGLNSKRPVRGYIDGRAVGLVRSMDIRASSVAAVELGFTPEFDLSARLLRSMFPPEGM